MKMTLKLLLLGGIIIFASVLFVSVILPWATISEKPSDIFRTRTSVEDAGRKLYIANGCTYCHTQFVRNIDWDIGASRVALSGDYVAERPHLLGTERTGPDLSQEGGEHPDDWHLAHYMNPRFVRPESVMPAFAYLGRKNIMALIAYKQALGFRDADSRTARQRQWKEEAVKAYRSGPVGNV
jgi:cytochrome c oxidase cbb3-type subunit II